LSGEGTPLLNKSLLVYSVSIIVPLQHQTVLFAYDFCQAEPPQLVEYLAPRWEMWH